MVTFMLSVFTTMKRKKKKLATIYATTWMTLEDIMQSERSQSQKAISYMTSFIGNVQNRQIH